MISLNIGHVYRLHSSRPSCTSSKVAWAVPPLALPCNNDLDDPDLHQAPAPGLDLFMIARGAHELERSLEIGHLREPGFTFCPLWPSCRTSEPWESAEAHWRCRESIRQSSPNR